MSRTGAAARSERRTTTAAGSPPERAASTRAWKLEPRPEASTPTRSSSGIDYRARPIANLAYLEDALPSRGEGVGGARHVARAHHEEIGDAHVEGAPHLRLLHLAALLDHAEDRRHRPGAPVDHRLAALGKDAGKILGDPAPRDVGHGEHGHAPEQVEHRLHIDARGLEELVSQTAAEPGRGVAAPEDE